MQPVRESSREDAPLDLFGNREGLLGDVVVGGYFGNTKQEIIVSRTDT